MSITQAGKGEQDDHEARQRNRHREPARRYRRRRKFNRRVGNDRDRGHSGEVQAADGEGEEQRPESFPLQGVTMQSDRERGGADRYAEQD
jgi:hypothetical protein